MTVTATAEMADQTILGELEKRVQNSITRVRRLSSELNSMDRLSSLSHHVEAALRASGAGLSLLQRITGDPVPAGFSVTITPLNRYEDLPFSGAAILICNPPAGRAAASPSVDFMCDGALVINNFLYGSVLMFERYASVHLRDNIYPAYVFSEVRPLTLAAISEPESRFENSSGLMHEVQAQPPGIAQFSVPPESIVARLFGGRAAAAAGKVLPFFLFV